jgi:fatty acid synthase subunit alpha
VARAILVEYDVEGTPKLVATPSFLAEALSGHASIFALFGRQGINEIYFDELQTLFDTYRPFVEPFLASIIDEVLQPLASASQGTSFYEHGVNVISWLSGSAPLPSVDYLASVPVSFPLIGLTQFTQYLVAARVSGLSPAELPARFSGASGHSQGLATTVAIFSSKDDASSLENVQKALKWLFFAGMRGQQLFPVLALEPSVVQDFIDGGEGQPTPMLSVNSLLLKDLQPHISKTNKYLPDNSQISVSLHYGPRNFIVTGQPRALYGLVANLRKIRAPNGSDQSKVEFSKRKPVFSLRFLVVGVPFHSQYLRDAADKVVYQDLHSEELWTAEGLQIPVYNTEDGG